MLTGFDLCRAAMAAPGVTGPERSVLLVLAIMADSDSAQCYPPVSGPNGITAKAVLSERSVQRAISRLVELGHISRKQVKHGVIYTVHPDLSALTPATQTPVTVTPASPTPDTQSPTPATVAPKLPVTTKHTLASAGADERGRRIDHDWQPTKPLPENVANVVAGWPPGRLDDSLDEFRDFWRSDAGKRATKLDWDLTWHNRLRAEIKHDKERNSRRGHRRDDKPRYRDPLLEREYRARADGPVLG